MDRDQIGVDRLSVGRQRFPGQVLVGEQGIAAMGRNLHRVETGAGGWPRLETPVGVPVLGEQRRLFVRLAPPAGEWSEVRLPVESFVATFRGRELRGATPLDPGRGRAIGLTISDKQAGPFELLVDWIAVERS